MCVWGGGGVVQNVCFFFSLLGELAKPEAARQRLCECLSQVSLCTGTTGQVLYIFLVLTLSGGEWRVMDYMLQYPDSLSPTPPPPNTHTHTLLLQ